MPQNETLLTYEGLKKLEEELEYLKTQKRREIAERIKVALGFGDLSENSEYDEAKNEQAQVEMRIVELENKLRNVKIIDEDDIETKTVQVGNIVQVLDVEYDEKVEYKIVGSTEADIAENKISNESPIGKALLGRKKNDVVDVETPGGMLQFNLKNNKIVLEVKFIRISPFLCTRHCKIFVCMVKLHHDFTRRKGNFI